MKIMKIVEAIIEKLNLSTGDHVKRFFNEEISIAKRNIKTLNHNLKTAELEFEQTMEELNHKLEDAEDRVVDAWTTIDDELIRTNEGRSKYRETYWGRIAQADHIKESIVKNVETRKEVYEDEVGEIKKKISTLEDRISTIENFKSAKKEEKK